MVRPPPNSGGLMIQISTMIRPLSRSDLFCGIFNDAMIIWCLCCGRAVITTITVSLIMAMQTMETRPPMLKRFQPNVKWKGCERIFSPIRPFAVRKVMVRQECDLIGETQFISNWSRVNIISTERLMLRRITRFIDMLSLCRTQLTGESTFYWSAYPEMLGTWTRIVSMLIPRGI